MTSYKEKRVENLKEQEPKLLEAYEYYLNILKEEFDIDYEDYLTLYMQPLLIHYKSLLERFKDSKTYKLSKSLCERLQDFKKPRDSLQKKITLKMNLRSIRDDENNIFKHVNFPMIPVFYGQFDEENHLEAFTKKMYVEICTNKKIRELVVK